MLTATEFWDEAVAAAVLAGATLLGADLLAGLYTNIPVISKTTVLADLVEATYTGYARQQPIGGAVIRDPNNGIAVLFASLRWQQVGGPAVPQTVQGVFYTSGAGPALVFVEPFLTPISLTDLLDAFETVLSYYESNGNQGLTTIIR